jgi:hypothetical protein
MYKLLLILLLVGCLALSVGHQTFAEGTVHFGNNSDSNSDASAFNTNIKPDTYDAADNPADSPDSIQSKRVLDNGYQYRHRYYHRNGHYARTSSQEMMLFMLFTMMVIIFVMA